MGSVSIWPPNPTTSRYCCHSSPIAQIEARSFRRIASTAGMTVTESCRVLHSRNRPTEQASGSPGVKVERVFVDLARSLLDDDVALGPVVFEKSSRLVMRRHKGRTSVAHRGASSNELPPTIRCRCMAMFADECVLKSVEEFFHGAPPACGSVVSPATTRFFVFGSRTDTSYPGHRPGEPAGRAVGQNCWQHVYG